MNLQGHLLLRIVFAALLCLLATTAYVLHDSGVQNRLAAQLTASVLGRQLELQLLGRHAGFFQAQQFPDFELWKQTTQVQGVCVRYASTDQNTVRSLCNSATHALPEVPTYFAKLYRWLFGTVASTREISYKRTVYGTLSVYPDSELAIVSAWQNISRLLGLSATTVLSVCVLVYISLRRALQPAAQIVSGLAQLGAGDLTVRLPAFALQEWQGIATAINQLAANQQQLLQERQQLLMQLMTVQEQERHDVARELHDEFGQCLAAINAVAAGIAQAAQQQCPALVGESAHIRRISEHLMAHVRELLLRLRPAELDELGLSASLTSLVANWNRHSRGKTRFQLSITGDCSVLAAAQTLALFRMTQESLTNIAKHAAATDVTIQLSITATDSILTITDNGIANTLPNPGNTGIGLCGIRERISALHGCFHLALAIPHGLVVSARLPHTR